MGGADLELVLVVSLVFLVQLSSRVVRFYVSKSVEHVLVVAVDFNNVLLASLQVEGLVEPQVLLFADRAGGDLTEQLQHDMHVLVPYLHAGLG